MPAFAERLREERRQLLESVHDQIHQGLEEAIATLRRLLGDEDARVAVKAAAALVQAAFKSHDVSDVQARLAAVEARMGGTDGR